MLAGRPARHARLAGAENLHSHRIRVVAPHRRIDLAAHLARHADDGTRSGRQQQEVIREPLAPGQVGRYDDSFEVRAFGDNLVRWGTPTVLIETGPWPSAEASFSQHCFMMRADSRISIMRIT